MSRIFIKTFGCAHNVSDSELMAGLLRKQQFELVDEPEESECIIINTCNVKGKTESTFFNYLEKTNALGKPIVIAGCIPQSMPERIAGYSAIGTHQLTNIVEVVEETLHGNAVTLLAREHLPRLNLPKIRKNPIVEIIPINKGCLGSCTFCITKKARGTLKSYPSREIVAQAEASIKEGVKEIWLTSEDTACWGRDIKERLPDLLRKLSSLEGFFHIRLGMGNPDWFVRYVDDLIDAMKYDRMFKFLHIPVQSGNNMILRKMKRGYRVEDYIEVVTKLQKAIPNITIATDIIVGFPGETPEQFQDTINLIKKTRPSVVNISRFTSRPGTPAADMVQLPGSEIKNRSRELTRLFEYIGYDNNKKWVGWEGKIIIDNNDKTNSQGRNYAYKPIVVEGKHPIGTVLTVRITKTGIYDLLGEKV